MSHAHRFKNPRTFPLRSFLFSLTLGASHIVLIFLRIFFLPLFCGGARSAGSYLAVGITLHSMFRFLGVRGVRCSVHSLPLPRLPSASISFHITLELHSIPFQAPFAFLFSCHLSALPSFFFLAPSISPLQVTVSHTRSGN